MGILQTGRVDIAYETSGSGPVDPTLIDALWSVRKSREAFIQEWVDYVRQFGSKKYFEGDDYSRRIAAALLTAAIRPTVPTASCLPSSQ